MDTHTDTQRTPYVTNAVLMCLMLTQSAAIKYARTTRLRHRSWSRSESNTHEPYTAAHGGIYFCIAVDP